MAIVKHIGLNLIRSTKATTSLNTKTRKAAWNNGYLAYVLRGFA